MGHNTIKRVPVDFSWPLHQVWRGYEENPYEDQSAPCEKCERTGYSPRARQLYEQWYGFAPFTPEETGSVPFEPQEEDVIARVRTSIAGAHEQHQHIREDDVHREAQRLCRRYNAVWHHHLSQEDVDALIAKDRLVSLTHTWSDHDGWQPKVPAPVITAYEVNRWSIYGFGHDDINKSVCIQARCQREDVACWCEACDGESITWSSPEAKAAFEAWQYEEPPAGPAYQLWETVSAGSPISPPFEKPEDLARWCAQNADLAGDKLSYNKWLHYIVGEEDIESDSLIFGVPEENYVGSGASLVEKRRNERR